MICATDRQMCPFIESALNIETHTHTHPLGTVTSDSCDDTELNRASGFGPVDDQKMEFTVDMFLRQRWNDPRLAFGQRLNNTASNIDTLRQRELCNKSKLDRAVCHSRTKLE